jgi:hypothetical protein
MPGGSKLLNDLVASVLIKISKSSNTFFGNSAGLAQQAIADKSGVSRPTISTPLSGTAQ